MAIYLGNLSVDRMEKRLEIQFPEELKNFLLSSHQDDAGKLAEGKWHCFDMPFVLVCYNQEMAKKIYEYLEPLADKMKGSLGIQWQN